MMDAISWRDNYSIAASPSHRVTVASNQRLLRAMPAHDLLLLDGATGTELGRRGADISLPLWSARAIIEAPDILADIHRDYLRAGADLITANTFRTHRRTLAKAGMG